MWALAERQPVGKEKMNLTWRQADVALGRAGHTRFKGNITADTSWVTWDPERKNFCRFDHLVSVDWQGDRRSGI